MPEPSIVIHVSIDYKELGPSLRQAVERILSGGMGIPEDRSETTIVPADPSRSLDETLSECERQFLIEALRCSRGNVTQAAALAGRNRTEFYKILQRHGLDASDYRDQE